MPFGAVKTLVRASCLSLVCCANAQAQCWVNVVLVKGRVEHAPGKARVLVQLIYSKGRPGESGEVTVENGRFSIPIEFLTQGNTPLLSNVPVRCNRKPKAVAITLVASDHEYDRVSLDFGKDFKRVEDSTAYSLRSEVLLKGPS